MNILYIKRRQDDVLQRFIADDSSNKDVLLVEGARQVGKTRLIENALETCERESCVLNLERDPTARVRFDNCEKFDDFSAVLLDRYGFDGDSGKVLFIDEAQESRRLGSFVRFMKEDWPHATVILTGSTLSRLFRNETRFPVGRVRHLKLGPFSFSEFLSAWGRQHLSELVLSDKTNIPTERHNHLLELFDTFLLTGGLPAVVLAAQKERDFEEVLMNIRAGYENDFIRLFGEETMSVVNACFRSVANFVGGVSKNTSVIASPNTPMNAMINEVFRRLESWNLLLRSDQRGPGPEASHRYLPKRYLFDTGLLRHLRESAVPSIRILDSLSAATRTPLGGVLENQTAIELSRFVHQLCGWKKTPSGTEIDFIVKTGKSTVPVECKASLKSSKRQHRGLLDYLKTYSLETGYTISFAPVLETIYESRRIINLPGYLLERMPDLILQG